MRETASTHYHVRTRQNVIDSDGSLLIYFGTLEGGTARTLDFCHELHKPGYCLDAQRYSPAQAAQLIEQFLDDHHIVTLNVAGPRASKQAQAQAYTEETIGLLLRTRPASQYTMP